MSHPRDPRLRRQGAGMAPPVDVAAAAVRLEVAADAMRAQQRERGPEQLAAAVQFGTTPTSVTAQEFADALGVDQYATEAVWSVMSERIAPDVEESPEPAPVAPMPPVDGAPASAHALARRVIEANGPGVQALRAAGAKFSSGHERALSWVSRHDVRSLSYGIRPTLAGSAPLTDRLWPVGPILDQGTEGACVGAAVVDAVNAARAGDADLDMEDAAAIYNRAQHIDERPGEDYSGTSVLAGMKAGVEAGLFGGYRWAFGTRDVAQAVLQVGPVVVGVPWLSGMYETGPGGLVTLSGDDQGLGHCLAVVGIRLKGPGGEPGPFFVWQNSWGAGYGDGGLGYIHHRDLARLLHGVGEAAIPTAEAQHVPL